MNDDYNIVIVPCYNEETRLQQDVFILNLKSYPDLRIIFVNDGSNDQTLRVLKNMEDQLPNQIIVLDLPKNAGKAQAIFEGGKAAITYQPKYIGYIDADLAVSIKDFYELIKIAKSENKNFVFGSRWRRIGSNIDRRASRHYIGRIFATIASNILQLNVYDTQCGAKVFDTKTAQHIFAQPFNVNWVFDVEIFFRILKIFPHEVFENHVLEYPLKQWQDVAGSKVKFSHSIGILKDFLTLKRMYGGKN